MSFLNASSTTRALATTLVIALGATGCAHKTMITTTKPGAEVFVEGESIGTTPVEYVETTSHKGEVFFEVRQEGVSKRFAVTRDQFDGTAVFGGIVSGIGLFGIGVGMITMGTALLLAGTAVIPVNVQAGLIMLVASLPLFMIGSVVSSFSVTAPILFLGEFSRALPKRIDVDWVSGDVLLTPQGTTSDLIGVSEGTQAHVPASVDGYE